MKRFWHNLLAVLLGNLCYFSVQRWLPAGARHTPFQTDWGIAVDFWFCLVFWGLLRFLKWFR
ncbi:MAG TPA: hypothetical protein VG672_23080 [Bryobacteraceae bacterium]|nr:hypothetical protein [Bryobacteraceae bacterium]